MSGENNVDYAMKSCADKIEELAYHLRENSGKVDKKRIIVGLRRNVDCLEELVRGEKDNSFPDSLSVIDKDRYSC